MKYWMSVSTYDTGVTPNRLIYTDEFGFDSFEEADEYACGGLVYLRGADAWTKVYYGKHIKNRKTVYIMTRLEDGEQ